MRTKNAVVLIFIIAILMTVFPIQSFAADDTKTVLNNTPSSDEISTDPNYSEGFVTTRSTVSGGCSITKVSSSSLFIAGYTICSPSSPAVCVTLKLQAYYSGAWHTLASISKQQSGTRVDLSQGYSVTTGFYYRTYASHTTPGGNAAFSCTNAILIE